MDNTCSSSSYRQYVLLCPLRHISCTQLLPVPSAASFYVPTLPDLQQDPEHRLHIYAGHLSSDPEAASLPATTVSAHVYFVLIKNRRVADRERVLFWFNVCLLVSLSRTHTVLIETGHRVDRGAHRSTGL